MMNSLMWKCEQVRAGQVYASTLFHSKQEAEDFVEKMQNAVPDLFFRIEEIEAKQVWN
jgi:hypothetical protein